MTEPRAMRLDKSVTHPDEDRYGFRHVATQLAKSVRAIGREGSAVIGIEGAWGSGKTSLLNMLRIALDEQKEAGTFVLNISPWLDGSGTSLVESLLIPVAGIIAAEEEKRMSEVALRQLKRRKGLTATADKILRYTQATARNLVPVAEAAALIGAPNASKALKALASVQSGTTPLSSSDLRSEIAEKIAELDLSFIILLDDLDRLEPVQAVEVIRLVKSVADFPRFRYLLCYDKDVLAQAICRGLGVEDGRLYLQKIVQIAFSLPRPETFVLRREFFEGATELYTHENGFPPDAVLLQDLDLVTDIYGATLRTPREVQLALNALRFRYPGIRDYVYLPDLCLLQLIRTTNPALYDWVEEYLTERAIVESGDGSVTKEEKERLIERLTENLTLYFPQQAHSAYKLSEWIPGLSGGLLTVPVSLFNQSGDEEKAQMTMQKRLGSSSYWRYYFAFSSPQNVLPPEYFDDIFALAADPEKQKTLADELLGRIHGKEISSRTWFEHILSQLTTPVISRRSAVECEGLARFFFQHGDEMTARYLALNPWFTLYELDTSSVVDRLLMKIYQQDPDRAIGLLHSLLLESDAWHWTAEYFRHLLWQHGLAGNLQQYEQEQWLSHDRLRELCRELAGRLNSSEITGRLTAMPSLTSYIWAWRDISGNDVVREWMAVQSRQDGDFLQLLLQLRYKGTSSAIGRYRGLSLSQFSEFLGDEQLLLERLERIEREGDFPELMSEVKSSRQNNHF
ncbi:KAP family P-loop NTPase fold protein [Enterobacter hormaechei]|uniref:KAP family P-loop NTPase fold protein n=1 Tax=Enterobacter hormaechei TaxID=158836 RepID=UPI00297899A6|nr:NTPase [Enterobacter cloacae]HAS1149853.1 NTPase [Enterobacter cloacae]HCM9645870.1 NTPase [Enterobacter hormaechei subsp. xiangfangensis]HDC4542850.1 NTPase [Enterobacter cloacae]